ncbi:hypothetical protein [Streptomyces sp. YIM S03343]
MLHAPYSVVEIIDALNFTLQATVLVFTLRAVRRFFRARDTA